MVKTHTERMRSKIKDKKLVGSAYVQAKKGFDNEKVILYSLAKFGWLTSHQVGDLVKKNEVGRYDFGRRVMKRLYDEKYVDFEKLERSSGGQMKAYFLKPKGMRVVKELPWPIHENLTVTSRTITKPSHQYHRLIGNQFLLDLRRGSLDLPFKLDSRSTIHSEHEVHRCYKGTAKSKFGCVPDGFLFYEEKRTLILMEVENSTRGPARHGAKFDNADNWLWNWMAPYTEKQLANNYYRDFCSMFTSDQNPTGDFNDAYEVFVCTSEKIFRSIWRKINELIPRFQSMPGKIFYVVMEQELWKDPLRKDNVKIYEHHDDKITKILAAADPNARSHREN